MLQSWRPSPAEHLLNVTTTGKDLGKGLYGQVLEVQVGKNILCCERSSLNPIRECQP